MTPQDNVLEILGAEFLASLEDNGEGYNQSELNELFDEWLIENEKDI
jgi:hypothetical protein